MKKTKEKKGVDKNKKEKKSIDKKKREDNKPKWKSAAWVMNPKEYSNMGKVFTTAKGIEINL